ncbi:hypothetical protein LNTAR_18358 [Lentisphaera araneosa HTCC2155]|uniref:Uncharacterized protein n=1 Tax=Lentisphaera araneosa HTCC2155 TaxID=313628 RepID=A6DG10_9BACT|nr:hypothetical protein LNTAR_18358 [Lentisphaera araneosa HTCC2155]
MLQHRMIYAFNNFEKTKYKDLPNYAKESFQS